MAPVESGAEETKAEQHLAYNVHPFEVEEGTFQVLKAEEQPRKRNRKFVCCAVFVSSVLILGILAAIFFPRIPGVSLYSSSLLDIDGFTGATANFVVKVENNNFYTLAFQNLVADVHDFDGIKIGTITRPERFKVEARSSSLVTTTGVFRASLPQIGLVGLNCLSNELETQVDIRATVDLRLFRGARRISFTTTDRVPCSVTNIGARGGARGAPVPASPMTPITRIGDGRGAGGEVRGDVPAPATPVAPVAGAAAPPPPSPVGATPRAPPPAAPVAGVTASPSPPAGAATSPPPPPAGAAAAPPPPPPAGADVPPPEAEPAPPAPTLVDQIGNAINEGINNLFGGGRGAGAAGVAASP